MSDEEDKKLTETSNQSMADEFARQFANFMRNSFAMNQNETNPPETAVVSYKIDTQPLHIGGDKLNGENYALWSVLMKTAISGRGMVSHVTGVPTPPPRTDPAFTQWQQADHCVFTWLTQNIESRLVSRISQHPTAKHIWDALAVRYGSGGDKIQVYDLQFKASTLRQGSSSLDEIWGRLQEIWISIDQKQRNPMKYPEDIEIHDKFIQDQRLCQFVYAIDSKYESTKREILKLDPLPSADFAYNLVQQEETRLRVLQTANNGGAVTTDGIGAGLAVRGWQNHTGGSRGGGRGGNGRNRRSDEEDKSKLVCSYCKRKKHTKDSCFELMAIPTGGKRSTANRHRRANLGTAVGMPPQRSEETEARKLAVLSSQQMGPVTPQHSRRTGPGRRIWSPEGVGALSMNGVRSCVEKERRRRPLGLQVN